MSGSQSVVFPHHRRLLCWTPAMLGESLDVSLMLWALTGGVTPSLQYFVIRKKGDNNLMQVCSPVVGRRLHGKLWEVGIPGERGSARAVKVLPRVPSCVATSVWEGLFPCHFTGGKRCQAFTFSPAKTVSETGHLQMHSFGCSWWPVFMKDLWRDLDLGNQHCPQLLIKCILTVDFFGMTSVTLKNLHTSLPFEFLCYLKNIIITCF